MPKPELHAAARNTPVAAPGCNFFRKYPLTSCGFQGCGGGNWTRITPPSAEPTAGWPMDADARGVIDAPCSTRYFGFRGPAHGGRTCLRKTGRTRPCIGDSRTGCAPKCWNKCFWRLPRTSRIEAASICGSASSTGLLFRRKKGALLGPHQARHGHQTHGDCEPPRSSCRRMHRECWSG